MEVVVPSYAAAARGTRADLFEGESLTVEELLYALMLPSGNDAALTLAGHFGKMIKNRQTKWSGMSRSTLARRSVYSNKRAQKSKENL